MVDDATLSREAYLIYQNTVGFEPVKGNLTEWSGLIRDKASNLIEVTIKIPSRFPLVPPDVYLPWNVDHLNISNGKFLTRSISRWKQNLHVFQIIREVKQVISASIIKTSSTVPAPEVEKSLNRQFEMLNKQLAEKKREYELLRSQGSKISNNDLQSTASQINEDVLINLQNEMFALEDAYDRADIDGLEFSKKFLDLQKRYYLIEKAT